MSLPKVGVYPAVDQLVEFQFVCLEQLCYGSSVEVAQIQNADFTSQCADVLYDGSGTGLADGEFIFCRIEFSAYRKRRIFPSEARIDDRPVWHK